MNDLYIQLIGFVGLGIGVAVFQTNKRHQMLVLSIISSLVWALHFTLLGAYTGAVMNLVGAGRNYVYQRVGKNRNPMILLSVLAVTVIAVAVTWKGPASLLPMAATAIVAFAFWQTKTHHIRIIALMGPFLWFTYNATTSHSIAGMASDAMNAVSILIGIYRFDYLPMMRKRHRLLARAAR